MATNNSPMTPESPQEGRAALLKALAKRLSDLAMFCNCVRDSLVCLDRWPDDPRVWCRDCAIQRASTLLASLLPVPPELPAQDVKDLEARVDSQPGNEGRPTATVETR